MTQGNGADAQQAVAGTNRIVCKFGGSSLASAEQMRKVKAIVDADERRRAPEKHRPAAFARNDGGGELDGAALDRDGRDDALFPRGRAGHF